MHNIPVFGIPCEGTASLSCAYLSSCCKTVCWFCRADNQRVDVMNLSGDDDGDDIVAMARYVITL